MGTSKFCVNGDDAAEGPVEEREVDGEGDAIVVLA